MTNKILKQLEIKNGKFTLEGKVIDAKILDMVVVDIDFSEIPALDEEIDVLKKELQTLKAIKAKEIIQDKLIELNEEKDDILEDFYKNFPLSANAYAIGTPLIKEDTNYDWGGSHFSYDHYPVLYLRIK